jgi:hypothetical protein
MRRVVVGGIVRASLIAARTRHAPINAESISRLLI